MATLTMHPYDASRVSWNMVDKRASAFASDLGLRPGHRFESIYDDACDDGICIVNHNTGRAVVWALRADATSEAFRFVPATESIHKYPHMQGWELTIYNT
jgi:hypothetical protein